MLHIFRVVKRQILTLWKMLYQKLIWKNVWYATSLYYNWRKNCNAQIQKSDYMCYFIFLLQGNTESAFSIYKEALKMAAAEKMLHALPILYVHFSRLKYLVGIICSFSLSIRDLTVLCRCYYKCFDYVEITQSCFCHFENIHFSLIFIFSFISSF